MWRILFVVLVASLSANDACEVVVDVQEPIYRDGVLTTDQGGVITSEGIRIQAQSITFTRKTIEGEPVAYVVAEGDLMLEYGDYAFIGERLEFDFISREGFVTNGRGALGTWYAGGATIRLCPDQTYIIEDAFITTCENVDSDWQLRAQEVCIRRGGWLFANMVNVWFLKSPIFYLPNFRTNLRYLLDAPIRYRIIIAGIQGSRVGLRYKFMTLGELKAFLRLEYILGRGPGAAIETEYCPPYANSRFLTQSYAAHDRSVNDPHQRWRYRFAGTYNDCLCDGHLSLKGSYDWLSDREMEQDYRISDYKLHTAHLSFFHARHQWDWSITNLYTRFRLRNFQEAAQELPTFEMRLRPFSCFGFTSYNALSLAYLDQVFAKESDTPGFHSGRLAYTTRLGRPIHTCIASAIPSAAFTGILYTNSPTRSSRFLASGYASLELNTRLSRCYPYARHQILPYARLTYTSTPSQGIPQHFIFSIDDGYTRQTYTRFGIRNTIHQQGLPCVPEQMLSLDIYTYAFISTPTIIGPVPRIYADFAYQPVPVLRVEGRTAWNATHKRVDHVNASLALTLTEDFAVSAEIRHRSPFAYRKNNHLDFVLDSFTQEGTLLASPISDKRNTLITHVFFRFTPLISAEIQTRNGWNRRFDPSYSEGRLTIRSTLRARWQLTTYFEWAEVNNSWGLSLKLGSGRRPCGRKPPPAVW